MLSDDAKKSVHTMPFNGKHKSSYDCACNPKFFKRCLEECDDGCWACKRGWVEITYNEAVVCGEQLHVVHFDNS